MNKTLKLAVAAALLAGASSANAGISIPAGDWTLDIGGIVNAYYTHTSTDGGGDSVANITTGLLPNYLVVSGSTRQNDLDVGFTISINPGASTKQSGVQSSHQENRQAFLTFGDASWGSVKIGKDLGIYASDAILNDMTLLGVGSAAGGLAGNTTTLGRIGRGFMYADWKSQIAFTSPNFDGLSFTVGATQGWNAFSAAAGAAAGSAASSERSGSSPSVEGKVSYAFTGDVAGKVWASFISQKVEGLSNAVAASHDAAGVFTAAVANSITDTSDRASAYDFGATVNVGGFGLTGYAGNGEGIGHTVQLLNGFDATGKARDSDQWYVQGTYVMATGTKLGASYGESTLDGNAGDTFKEITANMMTFGAYHPITKHLNLVAEYSIAEDETNFRAAGTADTDVKAKTVSLGAIMFF